MENHYVVRKGVCMGGIDSGEKKSGWRSPGIPENIERGRPLEGFRGVEGKFRKKNYQEKNRFRSMGMQPKGSSGGRTLIEEKSELEGETLEKVTCR